MGWLGKWRQRRRQKDCLEREGEKESGIILLVTTMVAAAAAAANAMVKRSEEK